MLYVFEVMEEKSLFKCTDKCPAYGWCHTIRETVAKNYAKAVEMFKETEKPQFFKKIREKRVRFSYPAMKPVNMLNRDISVAALQAFQKNNNKKLAVCEPLSGCGVRGIRYAKEVRGIEKVVVNDWSPLAFSLIRENVKINNVEDKVSAYNEEASSLMCKLSAQGIRFDVIDIDPYGSPVPFLDAAFKVLRAKNGFLCITATDTATLCGVYPETCYRKYHSKPLRTEYNHELAVRILTGYVAMEAARYDIGVKPVFSYFNEHHLRIFLETNQGARQANESIRKLGYILHCFNCNHREVLKEIVGFLSHTCNVCGSDKIDLGGPLWIVKIVEKDFSKKILSILEGTNFYTKKYALKFVGTILKEADAPIFYHNIHKVCKEAKVQVPPKTILIDELEKRGFKVHETHFSPYGIKTDASRKDLFEIVRQLQVGRYTV